ncbi:MAG: sulfatase-like hydrolase/transferase [bacterium]|nr:sulfatase-like hydrolase/transferase [bacterium]
MTNDEINSNNSNRAWYSPTGPFAFLVASYLYGLLLFAFLRLIFLIQLKDFSADLSVSLVLNSFLIGIRFDTVILLLALTPIILILPLVRMNQKGVRVGMVSYLTTAYVVLIILSLIDMRFFTYFESRLNYLAYEHLGEGNLVWDLALVDAGAFWSLVGWFLLSLLSFFVFRFFYQAFQTKPAGTWTRRLVLYLLLILVAGIGIRGRIDLAPLSWSAAYFSTNDFANQMALNPTYTLGKSYFESNHDPRLVYLSESDRFPFVPFDSALSKTRATLYQTGDIWLQPDSSLLRLTVQPQVPRDRQPNVVIFLMESWAGRYTGALGDRRHLTPHFDSLAAHGLLFHNCYANGMRTNYGIAATLCSFPALPGRSIMKRYKANQPFVSLPRILSERGYQNCFMYGGDLQFDNMEGFLRVQGYSRFRGQDNFPFAERFSKWGIPDHRLFDLALEQIDSLDQPFNLTLMTLSNHEPFELPDSSLERYDCQTDSCRELNSQIYADYAIGRFMEDAREMEFFDNTIFLFISDHTRLRTGNYYIDPPLHRIPWLIYAPALIGDSAQTIDKYCGQVDFLPTLMHLLGGDYQQASWGRNLFRLDDSDNGYAIMSVFERIGLLNEDYFYLEHIGIGSSLIPTESLDRPGQHIIKDQPKQLRALQKKLRSLMQAADQLSTPGALD